MNAKNKEMTHYRRFTTFYGDNRVDDNIDPVANIIDTETDSFVEDFIWNNSIENFEESMPKLLAILSPREKQVFRLIRDDKRNTDIAEILNLSKARISALMRQVETKLKQACKDLMIID